MRPVLAVSGHTTIPTAPGTDLDSNHKAVLMAGDDAEDCMHGLPCLCGKGLRFIHASLRLPCSPVNSKVSVFSISYGVTVNTLKYQPINWYFYRFLPNSYPLESPLTSAVICSGLFEDRKTKSVVRWGTESRLLNRSCLDSIQKLLRNDFTSLYRLPHLFDTFRRWRARKWE